MNQVYYGIDVSKTKLHLASEEKFLREFPNTSQGHLELIEKIRTLNPKRVVLEASGGYEQLVTYACQDNEIPVSVVQPGCVRNFAKSLKVLAKTDRIDAVVIARFGRAVKPALTEKTPENRRQLRALSDRRDQIIEDRVREQNRLETCADRKIRVQLQDSIDRLLDLEKELDREIETLLKSCSQLQRKYKLLTSQTGVGKVTARVLLGQFQELGQVTRQQAAALAGIAPHPQESGSWQGKRRIYGGRSAVRKALYMAARSAAMHCPVLSEVYKRLRENGKAYKVAIVACARKLLTRLNTLMKEFLSETATEA